MDIEHPDPDFDEMKTGTLSDLEERGEAIIDDAHYKGIAKLGCTTGTYYASLRAMKVPPKAALKLTREWMYLCEATDADR
jgi:hypothetical protein